MAVCRRCYFSSNNVNIYKCIADTNLRICICQSDLFSRWQHRQGWLWSSETAVPRSAPPIRCEIKPTSAILKNQSKSVYSGAEEGLVWREREPESINYLAWAMPISVSKRQKQLIFNDSPFWFIALVPSWLTVIDVLNTFAFATDKWNSWNCGSYNLFTTWPK